ncbi:hypothetical protein TNCV_3299651 [Trichonephila clavipes]|nr:hypothetical protein TNCV_3299651 [Trichonephila clavipes]
MDATVSEQSAVVRFLTEEDELDADIYQRMGTVYGEHCFVQTIGDHIFVKGGQRYQISMKSPMEPRQP